jgi:hypothetical protein
MAREGELRKIFTHTDQQPTTLSGTQALKELMQMSPVEHRVTF